MGSAKKPLIRTMPMPLSPNGVEMAAIVSSSLSEIFSELSELMDKEPLFNAMQRGRFFLHSSLG